MRDHGSTRSPGQGSATGWDRAAGQPGGSGPAARGPRRGRPAPRGAPVSRKPRMSFLVTRPACPLPGTPAMSMPCSAAIFRTSGVDRRRSRSSAVSGPLPPVESATAAGRRRRRARAPEGWRGRPRQERLGRRQRRRARGAGAAARSGRSGGARRRRPSRSRAGPPPCSPPRSRPAAPGSRPARPRSGAGISASTLSVEISNIGSSRFTSSPSCLSHFESVPSAIDSPIWGMMTSMRAMQFLDQVKCLAMGYRLLAT